MVDLEEALKIKQLEWEQVSQENNDLEKEKMTLLDSHEKHRDLIGKLKDELQRQVDKNNQVTKEKE